MRTRLLVGLLAIIACGQLAAQGGTAPSPAAPSTAETPSAAQAPTERQPTDSQPAGSQAAAQGSPNPGSPNPAADAPIAPATATQGGPTAPATATQSPNPQPSAAPSPSATSTDATAVAAIDFSATQPGDAAAGEQKAAVCGACHGIDGNSADAQYPKLAGQNELYIARQLALYKSGERANPIMQGMAAPLSPQDMRDLGAFFATKQVKAGLASDALIVEGGEETWAQRGAALYRGGNGQNATPACMACHGPTGRGNPGTRYPALAGQHADYTKAQLTAFRAGEVRGKGPNANTIMAGVASQLSDQDIEALSTFIEGLHRRAVEGMPAGGAPSHVAPAAAETHGTK